MFSQARDSTRALVDTGADVSVISNRLYSTIRNGVRTRPPPPVNLKSANGGRIKIVGEAELNFNLGGRLIAHSFLIVEGVKTECILGADFLHQQKLILDAGKRKLYWPKRNLVSARSKMLLAPRTTKRFKVRVHGVQAGVTGDWIFDPVHPYLVESMVSLLEPSSTWVVAENASDLPVTIPEGERLGFIEHCHTLSLDAMTKQPNRTRTDLDPQTFNVKLDNIPVGLHARYTALIKRYSTVFSKNQYDVGQTKVLPQNIILKDSRKIACTPPYRTPEHLRPIAEDFIIKLSQAGIVTPSLSPFNSPLMLVKKGDANPDKPLSEQYRVVHDYRRLNENTVRDSYPMRNLYELLDAVAQAKVWSVIDLSSGFWNQELTPQSRPYTAFGFPGSGHWEYTRCAQGLTNSPAAFQRLLDHVLTGLDKVHVYIDDVIVCSDNHEEHILLLAKVLERFKKFNLKCKLSKLQLGAGEVNYLGYNISRDKGIRAGAVKIQAVWNWTAPTTVTEIKQFLGLCSFFRRTIPRFAEVASPLTRLTRKDANWKNGVLPEEALKAFQSLKDALCSRPCLTPVSFDREFILTTDASEIGLGAVLSQVGADGQEHPCAYASRVLNEAEKKWAPTRLEHLAMVWACRHFRPYLAGKHFTMRTDHKPLCGMNRVQGQALERLQAELDDFRPFTVQYLKGDKMPADGLSRKLDNLEVRSLPKVVSMDQLHYMQRQDQRTKSVACWVRFAITPNSRELQEYLEPLKSSAEMTKGLVCIRRRGEMRVLVPEALKPLLLYHAHDSPLAGHRSFQSTLERLQQSWYWPNMEQEVELHCKGCKICLAVNQPAHKAPVAMGKLPPVSRFNQRVHVDLMGPLPREQGSRYLLVIQDAHTKWVELVPLMDKTAVKTVKGIVTSWITRHGCMEGLVSDQGKEFVNSTMTGLCEKLHISHQTSSVMHPQSNGLVERTNRTIIAHLRKYLEGSNDWVNLLPSVQFAFNSNVHSSTKHPPFRLVYGRRPNVPDEMRDESLHPRYTEDELGQQLRRQAQLQQEVAGASEEAWKIQKATFDKRCRQKQLIVGDVVYLNRPHSGGQFQKFQQLFMGPYTVLKLLSNDNVELIRDDGKISNVHKNRIKLASFSSQVFRTPPSALGPAECSTHTDTASSRPTRSATPAIDDGTGTVTIPLQRRRRVRIQSHPSVQDDPPAPQVTPPREAPGPVEPRGRAPWWDRVRRLVTPPSRPPRSRTETREAGVRLPHLFPSGRLAREEAERMDDPDHSSADE